ncbi:LLM class flavin-dependent oxidoreductase [Nonomuraea sp. NPDC049419]|uniref:LLM class flavin-dependent oxidoreductase n=1 Tax=Nonomuraea sp. NPDC049419 TaxID=3155772 RepID=UPI003440FC03
MRFAVLCVPYALDYAAGTDSVSDVIAWDLQVASWADQYGLDEVFFAEHHTLGHEPGPAPELMIAAASQQTTRVRLGALGHLVPYHNPVALAHRMIWLDHLTGGRYVAGVAPGAFPTDAQLFGTGVENARMLAEGLDIIQAIFTQPGPWRIDGRYWTADMPEFSSSVNGPHLKPLQRPHPEILMTGMQPKSPTLAEAGRRGHSPVSQEVSSQTLIRHWETYAEAAEAAGHTPRRSSWRVTRDIWLADTDEKAREQVLSGPLGEVWSKVNLPLFKDLGLGSLLAGADVPEHDLCLEWLVDNFFLIGSPETVAKKIEALHAEVGGFGTLLMGAPGRGREPDTYRRSLELLGSEVAPRLSHLVAGS